MKRSKSAGRVNVCYNDDLMRDKNWMVKDCRDLGKGWVWCSAYWLHTLIRDKECPFSLYNELEFARQNLA